jgi:hypothetical protein
MRIKDEVTKAEIEKIIGGKMPEGGNNVSSY